MTALAVALTLLVGQPAAAEEAEVWTHPLAPVLTSGKANWTVRGRNTADLYHWAVSHGVPIRQWRFTRYHPDESSGMGGGWSTTDGGGFRQDCIASALRHYSHWRQHEFWVQGHGRVTVGDNGPGWRSRYRFDLPGLSGRWVDKHDAGVGIETMRCIVVWCPRPGTCDCDWARAWRKTIGG